MIITPAEIRRLFSFPHFLPEKPLMLYNILLLSDVLPAAAENIHCALIKSPPQ